MTAHIFALTYDTTLKHKIHNIAMQVRTKRRLKHYTTDGLEKLK
jgi:hypothetical protein